LITSEQQYFIYETYKASCKKRLLGSYIIERTVV
jgi:hypothetical protein